MKAKQTLFFLHLSSLFIHVLGSRENEFFSVEKSDVIHTFAKVNIDWIDNFIQNNFPSWENDTFEAFNKVKDKDGIAIDIGAWFGTTAIWLAKHFAYVVAIEADINSVEYLEKNLKASGCSNVIICNNAVSDDEKLVIFGPRLTVQHGDLLNGSTSFVKNMSDASSDYLAQALPFHKIVDTYVTNNKEVCDRKVTFIKCDIEGGEEMILTDILEFALENNCKVWMSFHLPWWTEKKIADFADLFKKFSVDVPSQDVGEYLAENPFGSVLFEPHNL